jgi:hypothetical protein
LNGKDWPRTQREHIGSEGKYPDLNGACQRGRGGGLQTSARARDRYPGGRLRARRPRTGKADARARSRLRGDPEEPLFRTIGRGTGKLTRTVLPQANAYAMIGQRAAAAGIATKLGNHSFRATGIRRI